MGESNARREFLRASVAMGAGLVLVGCAVGDTSESAQSDEKQPDKDEQPDKVEESEENGEVTATEDLMREHGVLRRALLIYTAAATKLRANPSNVPPDALQKTASLFRSFGEDYHEKKLEEAYIFPAVKKAGGEAAGYADILVAQHDRGREINEYIVAVTRGAKLGATNAVELAKALEAFVLMYQHHAAREDTIIFPAWKLTMTGDKLDEMGDKFDDIEREQFGGDGYETAVKQIADIEGSLGLTDISQFTAPPPPKLAGA